MLKVTKNINFKAAVAGVTIFTITSTLIPNDAEAFPFRSKYRPNSELEVVFDLTEGISSSSIGFFDNAIQNFRIQTSSDVVDFPVVTLPGTERNNLDLNVTVSNIEGINTYQYSFDINPIVSISDEELNNFQTSFGRDVGFYFNNLEKVVFFVPSQLTEAATIFNFNGSLTSLNGFEQLFNDLANAGIEEIGFQGKLIYNDENGKQETGLETFFFSTSLQPSKSVPEPNNLMSLLALGVIAGYSYFKSKLI